MKLKTYKRFSIEQYYTKRLVKMKVTGPVSPRAYLESSSRHYYKCETTYIDKIILLML
jgi:methionine synthase II (cobalamin-independent)